MLRGFTIPQKGLALLAKLHSGSTLEITRVMVGDGQLPDDGNLRDLEDLIAPIAQATSTKPVTVGTTTSFIVQYRNDLNGGLDRDININEYGVFANDPDEGEILLYYANLGAYCEPVPARRPNEPVTAREYPVSIGVAESVEVVLGYMASAYMTAEDVEVYCTDKILPMLADKQTQDQIKQDTTEILAELRGQRPKRYGYRVKISEPDPYHRVEYLFDAVGMTPAHMDYDRHAFDYGSWKDIWFVRDNYPCMVRADGTEDYRLDPNDYTKKLADGADSDVSNQQYDGNAMAAIPLCWVSRYQEGGYQYVIFCEFQYDESYKAYAHTRPDGTIAKNAYHALFEGSMVGNKLRSLAGDDLYPQSNTQAQAELTAAKANGTKWSIRTWSLHSLIADLCTLISKTMNSQEAFGQGNTTGYYKNGVSGDSYGAEDHYGFCACGSLKDKGQFFGYGPETTTKAVKVFHIENFWGNRWDRLVGLVLDNGTYKAKMTPEGNGYNLTGAGYTAVGPTISDTAAASGSGWQKETIQTEFGRLPIMPLEGSGATYETDFYWYNRDGVRVALAGGHCSYGYGCGARYLTVSTAESAARWSFGASLSLEDPS